jgi:hypothetical protein
VAALGLFDPREHAGDDRRGLDVGAEVGRVLRLAQRSRARSESPTASQALPRQGQRPWPRGIGPPRCSLRGRRSRAWTRTSNAEGALLGEPRRRRLSSTAVRASRSGDSPVREIARAHPSSRRAAARCAAERVPLRREQELRLVRTRGPEVPRQRRGRVGATARPSRSGRVRELQPRSRARRGASSAQVAPRISSEGSAASSWRDRASGGAWRGNRCRRGGCARRRRPSFPAASAARRLAVLARRARRAGAARALLRPGDRRLAGERGLLRLRAEALESIERVRRPADGRARASPAKSESARRWSGSESSVPIRARHGRLVLQALTSGRHDQRSACPRWTRASSSIAVAPARPLRARPRRCSVERLRKAVALAEALAPARCGRRSDDGSRTVRGAGRRRASGNRPFMTASRDPGSRGEEGRTPSRSTRDVVDPSVPAEVLRLDGARSRAHVWARTCGGPRPADVGHALAAFAIVVGAFRARGWRRASTASPPEPPEPDSLLTSRPSRSTRATRRSSGNTSYRWALPFARPAAPRRSCLSPSAPRAASGPGSEAVHLAPRRGRTRASARRSRFLSDAGRGCSRGSSRAGSSRRPRRSSRARSSATSLLSLIFAQQGGPHTRRRP